MSPILDRSAQELLDHMPQGAVTDRTEWGPEKTPLDQLEYVLSRPVSVPKSLSRSPFLPSMTTGLSTNTTSFEHFSRAIWPYRRPEHQGGDCCRVRARISRKYLPSSTNPACYLLVWPIQIKEGKQALRMTRLSCHRFRSNQVRLALSLLAYNWRICGGGWRYQSESRTGRSRVYSNDW